MFFWLAFDAVDGSSTDIAMCQIAFLLRGSESLLMAMNGSSDHLLTTSACYPTSDVAAVGRESPKLTQAVL